MDIVREKLILAPPAVIFDCVVNAELIPQWMDNVESIRYTSDIDPLQPVGTTFSQRVREGIFPREYSGEVVEYRAYDAFGVRFGDRRFRFQLNYSLTEVAGGTRVVYRLRSVRESAFMALAGRMVRGMAAGMADQHIRGLKNFAESRS